MARAFLLSFALLVLPVQAEPRTVQFDVQKMTCATCPITVRLSLMRIKGVLDARVTLEPPVAVVTYDDARTGIEQLERATADAGFPSKARRP